MAHNVRTKNEVAARTTNARALATNENTPPVEASAGGQNVSAARLPYWKTLRRAGNLGEPRRPELAEGLRGEPFLSRFAGLGEEGWRTLLAVSSRCSIRIS